MLMAAEIQSLLKLQELDMRHQALGKALGDLPVQKEISELEERLASWRASLACASTRLARARKEQKEEEWTVRETAVSIDSISKKLYGGMVANPREIESMHSRLEALKTTKTSLEDRVIELMEEIETLEHETAAVRAQIAQEEGKLKDLKAARDLEAADLSSKLASVAEERDAVRPEISDMLLARYEQLAREKGGLAVVPVRDGRCGGCHVTLPTFLISLAKPNNTVVRCESWGRILCWVG